MQYDVIVAGAGPSGSTVARELAQRGVSVAMLDKAAFPRDKPCGGAVSTRCRSLIGVDLSPVIERTIDDIRITMHQRPASELFRQSREPFGYLTQRSRLDELLAEYAVAAGADFQQRARVTSVERGDGVTVRAGGRAFRGRVLVAADGANGVAAKMAGVRLPDHNNSVALEGNITPGKGFPKKWDHAIGMDFGTIQGGYGWIFPKGDHLNIGLGGYKQAGPKLRAGLHSFVKFYGYDPDALWGVRGHHLPCRLETSALVDGNVVLVGDAAGLLDPLTGEGILAAVRSGQAAAAAIADHLWGRQAPQDGRRQVHSEGLERYAESLEEDILAENRAAMMFHDLLYLAPSLFYRIERRAPILWRAMVDVLRGDVTYADLSRRGGPIWPAARMVSRLARGALRRLPGQLRREVPPSFASRRRGRGAKQ